MNRRRFIWFSFLGTHLLLLRRYTEVSHTARREGLRLVEMDFDGHMNWIWGIQVSGYLTVKCHNKQYMKRYFGISLSTLTHLDWYVWGENVLLRCHFIFEVLPLIFRNTCETGTSESVCDFVLSLRSVVNHSWLVSANCLQIMNAKWKWWTIDL